MRHRLPEPQHLIHLDLDDAFQEQRWVVVGPEASEFAADEYRERVEAEVRELAERHPAFLRLAVSEELSDRDIAAIEELLNQPTLFITEATLRAAYLAPHGTLVSLLRHALGIEELPSRSDAIRSAFEAFISEKGYLGPDQLVFIRLFARRLTQVGRIEAADLLEEPFVRLGVDPARQLPSEDVEALFALAAQYEI